MATSILVRTADLPAPAKCLAFRVGEDENSMWPVVCPRDTVVADTSLRRRRQPEIDGIYVLRVDGRGFVRRCRKVGARLLILSDQEPSAGRPITWISLEHRTISEVVRGRIVWIGRSLA